MKEETARLAVSITGLLTFLLVNVADTLSTVAGLKMGLVETNPVADWFYQSMGYPGLWYHKGLFLCLYTVMWEISRRIHTPTCDIFTGIATGVMLKTVQNNVVLVYG